MKINIADKGLKLEEKSLTKLSTHLEKVKKLLPHFNEDLLSVNFFIKRNDDKYHFKKKHHSTKDYINTKNVLAHFEGWMRLILPKKALYTHFKGADVDECIYLGIKNLLKEVKKYKDLHFKSQSQYPHHESIRRFH